MDYIIKNTYFGKINDLNLDFEIIYEFIENYIYDNNYNTILLSNLSNLYVIVASFNFEENLWNDILSEDQYKLLEKNDYILCYLLMEKKPSKNNNSVYYIDIIDTRLKKYNLAMYLIECYEKNVIKEKCYILPGEIIYTAVGYWEKYFKRKYKINKEDLYKFINKLKISNDLKISGRNSHFNSSNRHAWKYLLD